MLAEREPVVQVVVEQAIVVDECLAKVRHQEPLADLVAPGERRVLRSGDGAVQRAERNGCQHD